jgi:lactate permease
MACAWLTPWCWTLSLPFVLESRNASFATGAKIGVKDLIDWLFAFSPILVILVLMLGFRWGGMKAGPVGCLVAMLVAVAYFGAGLELLLYSQLKALLLTLFVLYIIWMALFFYHTVDEAGAVAVIGLALPRLTANRALQVLLVGWVFSAFLQGAGGFGVPVAVTAPLLVGLGFPRLAAVVIPSLGHGWAVTFGSLGSSFYALIAATGQSGADLAPWSAVMLGFCCLICGAAVLWAAGGRRALRDGWVPMLIIGVGMASVQYVVVVNGFWSLGSLCAGLAGLAFCLLLFRLPRFQGSAEQRAAVRAQPLSIPLPLALAPYVILMLVIIGGQLVGPVKTVLGQVVIRAEFPELSTSQGWVTLAETGRTINVFGHAGALLFYASIFSFLLLLWKRHYRPGAMKRIVDNTVRRAVRSSIGVATMVGMAVVMQHAGMTRTLAEGVAATFGSVYPLVSPFIGALGAFITGSNTNSNVVFGPFQQDAARLLGLNEFIILAAQTAGGAIGSTFAPAKIIVGASTVGLGGSEGPVLKKVMIYGTLLVALIGLATGLAIAWVG